MTRVLPPLALMGLIFYLSAQPQLGPELGTFDVVLRKLAHFTEYAVLWVLLWRALGYERPRLAVVIAVAYACTDEFHQTFVDGRNGTPVDVLIDSAGIVFAYAVAQRVRASRAQSP